MQTYLLITVSILPNDRTGAAILTTIYGNASGGLTSYQSFLVIRHDITRPIRFVYAISRGLQNQQVQIPLPLLLPGTNNIRVVSNNAFISLHALPTQSLLFEDTLFKTINAPGLVLLQSEGVILNFSNNTKSSPDYLERCKQIRLTDSSTLLLSNEGINDVQI